THQRSVVLQRVMRRAHDAVRIPAAVADEDDGKIMQANVIANLLERASVEERRDAICPRSHSAARQTGGYGDHILLGDARVDKPCRQGVAQRLQRAKPEITREKDELRVPSGFHQCLAEDFSHTSLWYPRSAGM